MRLDLALGRCGRLTVNDGKKSAPGQIRSLSISPPPLEPRFVHEPPQRLIGDRAYDADGLGLALAHRGVEMIAPHRRGRVRPKTQDGRPLRRYCRRPRGLDKYVTMWHIMSIRCRYR